MSSDVLTHDATASTKGTIYQLYWAVQKCFELISGQKIIIERYGDVTVAASQQLEIKNYGDALTDSHLNLWKTLKNWMQDGFNETSYSALLLCTTQQIGEKSSLSEWNSKVVEDRLTILQAINSDAEERERARKVAKGGKPPNVPESLGLIRWVMDPVRADKLRRVIERFIIASGTPHMEELYARLKDEYAKGILVAKRDDFLNALLGFVICPEVVVNTGWEVTYEDFAAKVEELTGQYCRGTTQFPVKYLPPDEGPPAEVVEARKGDLFVTKIQDIEYRTVIPKAISDYTCASDTALKELRDYEVPFSKHQRFAREVLDQFEPHYRLASRSVTDVIKQSQDFYDEVMMQPSPGFPGFENPPRSFRNGVLHMHVDDVDKDIKWRLEKS